VALVTATGGLAAFLGGPAAWLLHLLSSYGVIAVACMRGTRNAGVIVGVLTIVLAAAAGASGLLAVRRWRDASREDEAEAVLMVVGMLGAALFALTIGLQTVVALVVPTCA
jgi:uncharacterized membrane protein YhaH (DUF805 family)